MAEQRLFIGFMPPQAANQVPCSGCTVFAVSIGGRIGTGKSTLVKDAMKRGLVGSVEHINHELLGDYVRTPSKHAFTLQLCAMQGAVVRTQHACQLAALDKRTMVIERAAQENIIFAVANRDAGSMTEEQFKAYLRYIKKDIQKCNEFLADAKYHNLMLSTNEGETLRRMIERGDLSEKDYDDDYVMERLGNAYFRAVLESLTPEASPAWYNLKPYVVIDWSNYGSWESVEKLLFATENISGDVLASKPIRFVIDATVMDGEKTTPRRDPYWSENNKELHMDLAWYEMQSPKSHKHQRSVFRDKFFDALSKRQTVVFHGSENCKMSLVSYRHVYVDI